MYKYDNKNIYYKISILLFVMKYYIEYYNRIIILATLSI